MANYGASRVYLDALHDFEEQGYCVVRDLLDTASLAPVRELVCTSTRGMHTVRSDSHGCC